MQNDNIYPNDGRYFNPKIVPSERKRREDAEIEAILEQVPLIKDIIRHINVKIAELSSIDGIKTDIDKSPDLHQKEVYANKIAVAKLKAERNYLMGEVSKLKR